MRLIRYFKDPAIGFPFLGFAIRGQVLYGHHEVGVWMERSRYGRVSVCLALWWVVELTKVEIKVE